MRAHWLRTPKSSMLLLCSIAFACEPNQFVSMGSDGEAADSGNQVSDGGSAGGNDAANAASGQCLGGVGEAAAGSGVTSGFAGGTPSGMGGSAGANPPEGVSGAIFRLPRQIQARGRN